MARLKHAVEDVHDLSGDWPSPPDWPDPTQTKRRKTGGMLAPGKLSLAEKRLECYRRRLEGDTFEEIAEAMNINTSTAWRNCQAMADEVRTRAMDTAESLLWLEVARLDSVMAAHWRACTVARNPASTATVLKTIELRSRLLGLFPATKLETKSEVKTPFTGYAIDKLNLDVETRMKILAAMDRAAGRVGDDALAK